jgi:hypothetical protein
MRIARNRFMSALLAVGLLALVGCAGSSRYVNTGTPDNKGAGFGDTDVKLLIDDIMSDLLQAPFIQRYKPPVTISLLHIANKTSEFIDTDALLGDKLMTSIIKSGSGVFEFVDRKMLDESIREAELGADGLVAQGEVTRLGRAAGVTLLMSGELSSVRKMDRKEDQRFYRLSMRLVDTERNTVVWLDDKELRKVAQKGVVQW